MILVTAGTQLPFDRLIRAVDEWAARNGRTDVFAQIGPEGKEPQNIRWKRTIPPQEFRQLFEEADCIVAHAGIGTILAALELAKPIIVVPRQAALNEHRTNHQMATAQRFSEMGLVKVVYDETDLPGALESAADLQPCVGLGNTAIE